MTSPADDIIPLYRRHAQAWARRRVGAPIPPKWIDRFAGHLPPQAHVLDLGCGSGDPIARHFLQSGHRVTGIDASPELLAIARAALPEGSWQHADMRTLDLEARFEGVLAWNSSFHLTPADQRGMFEVFRRHCLPRAVLMFTAGHQHGDALGTFEGDTLYHGSLDPSEYRDLLDQHGFDVIDHVLQDPDCGSHTVWLARYRD